MSQPKPTEHVRVEVVTPCEHGKGRTHWTADGWCEKGRTDYRGTFTEWPPEAIEATAEAIYYAELPTSSFDKMGRTVPFGESMSPDQFREAAAQVVAALWDHITGKDETPTGIGLHAKNEEGSYEALIGEVGLRLLRRVNRGETLTPERAVTEILNVFDAALKDKTPLPTGKDET